MDGGAEKGYRDTFTTFFFSQNKEALFLPNATRLRTEMWGRGLLSFRVEKVVEVRGYMLKTFFYRSSPIVLRGNRTLVYKSDWCTKAQKKS